MKTAFVFTGCGALGAFQAGAAKKLVDDGVVPDAVYGVSSGAVNALAFSFLGADGNVEFWSQFTELKDAFEPNLFNVLFRGGDGVFRHAAKLSSWMRERLGSAEAASVDTTVYTLQAVSGVLDKHVFVKGRSPNALSDRPAHMSAFDVGMAACAIPGMCQSWEGRVDAGTRILAPLKDAIADGAERLYVISGQRVGQEPKRNMFWPRPAAAAYHGVVSVLAEILARDLAVAEQKNHMAGFKRIDVNLVQPGTQIGSALDFDLCKEFVATGLRWPL